MKKLLVLCGVAIIISGAGMYMWLHPYNEGIVLIRKNIFFAEHVRNEREIAKGLGERDAMCGRCAMVFHFNEPRIYTFWMKDMRFDIDIVWLLDGRVVHSESNVSHVTPEKTYTPDEVADTVIEFSAGTVENMQLKIGDHIRTL